MTVTEARIGDYVVERQLGSGGMGSVYLGRSPSGRAVAIKVVRAEYAADPEFRARFREEVEAARRVGGFHTAAVVDADPDAPQPWMASAYVKGPTLAAAVADSGPLEERELRALGAGLAEALKAIHACGLVHRDLKPGNIVLTDDGPRVLDFGIAHALESTRLTAPGVWVGTTGFMAPEQIRGGAVDGACDVFALGAVLVAAAGGSAFGEGPPLSVAHRTVADAADVSAVPEALRPVVQECLRKEPGRRPTPGQLLETFAGSGGTSHSPDGAGDARGAVGAEVPVREAWEARLLKSRELPDVRPPGGETGVRVGPARSPHEYGDPQPASLYCRPTATVLRRALGNLLQAAGLAAAAVVTYPGWDRPWILFTIAAGVGAALLLRRGALGLRRTDWLEIDDRGITVIFSPALLTLRWGDIGALELDSPDQDTDWVVVRPAEGRTAPTDFLPHRWVRTSPDGDTRIRTDKLVPSDDDTDTITAVLQRYAERHSIALNRRSG
ncbi:serine/threonine-protein kinase [Streptomyces sp. NPDC020965]|uniref:serine/threonine-protein kinase n=1 Tax=Streptomyces sp. NPDC020965 TaxID=3365105 RepID=UPI00378EFA56